LRLSKSCFPQILLLCNKAGLVRAGVIALDGTKVKGNASLGRNRTYEQLCKEERWLEEQVNNFFESAEEIDREEDHKYGERQGNELPNELCDKKRRLARIREAKKYLEEKAKQEAEKKASKDNNGKDASRRAVKPDAKINMTDFDSRIQKNCKGYVQGYNAQAVATEDQVIVASDVVNEANDYHQLKPMLEQAQENLSKIGVTAKTVVADAGYCTEENLEYLESKEDINGLVSTRREREMRKKPGPSKRKSRSEKYRVMDSKLSKPVGRYVYGFRIDEHYKHTHE